MIDIFMDYAAISLGTAQATGTRVLDAGRVGAGAALAWSASSVAEVHQDPRAAVARAPVSVVQAVRSGLDRAAGWIGDTSVGSARALRRQVQRVDRHRSDLGGGA